MFSVDVQNRNNRIIFHACVLFVIFTLQGPNVLSAPTTQLARTLIGPAIRSLSAGRIGPQELGPALAKRALTSLTAMNSTTTPDLSDRCRLRTSSLAYSSPTGVAIPNLVRDFSSVSGKMPLRRMRVPAPSSIDERVSTVKLNGNDSADKDPDKDLIEALNSEIYLPLNEANCKIDPDSEERFLFLATLVDEWAYRARKLSAESDSPLSKLNRASLYAILHSVQRRIKNALYDSTETTLVDRTLFICNPSGEVMALAIFKPADQCLHLELLATSPFNFESNGKRKAEAIGSGREAIIAVVKRSLANPETRGCVSGSPTNSAKSFYTQFTHHNSDEVWRVERPGLNDGIKRLLALRKIQSNSLQPK